MPVFALGKESGEITRTYTSSREHTSSLPHPLSIPFSIRGFSFTLLGHVFRQAHRPRGSETRCNPQGRGAVRGLVPSQWPARRGKGGRHQPPSLLFSMMKIRQSRNEMGERMGVYMLEREGVYMLERELIC